jgi:hypothetical protein
LKRFAEFVTYDQDLHPCCQIAREDANEDPEQYDCASCPVAAAYQDLADDRANVQAWQVFRQLTTRFAFDAHAGGVILDRITYEMATDSFEELVHRLAVLYDVCYPEHPHGT